MPGKKKQSDHTKCVAAHGDAGRFDGAMTTPIYQTSNYRFTDSLAVRKAMEGRGGYVYARYSNPTVEAAEEKLAALENGEQALLFASGMAATTSVCLAFLKAGDRLVAAKSLYGGTQEFFDNVLQRFGIRVDYLAPEDFTRLPAHLAEPPKLLWFETPVNPNLKILDIAPIAAGCRGKGVLTVIDNTFATPINQKPLDLGVDLVMHSASKYIGGHSDLIGGVVIGAAEHLQKIYEMRKLLGGCADPHLAFLIGRGLKTLAVRVEKHNQNAQKIAEFMQNHPRVSRVFYPGLPDAPGHEIAKKQMAGFGGMVCFAVIGGLDGAIKVIDSFKLIANAGSLGGVESMACLPALTSHFGLSAEQRQAAGISDGMIRLSVGLESPADLMADLDQALGA